MNIAVIGTGCQAHMLRAAQQRPEAELGLERLDVIGIPVVTMSPTPTWSIF